MNVLKHLFLGQRPNKCKYLFFLLFFSGYVTDVAVDADGRYFVTAESDQRVLMWNLKSRVVLQKDTQTHVVQLLILEESRPDTILGKIWYL